MWGSIIGDIAGSIYEYGQVKKVMSVSVKDIIPVNGFYSDDTILTIAVVDAILNNGSYEDYLKKYAREYSLYVPNHKPYFKSIFSPGFTKWVNSEGFGFSTGNGAMMRIAGVGYLFDTEADVIKNARLATIPSHNTIEAIECATLVSLVIYYARTGLNKEDIIKKLGLIYSYVPFKKFNMTCYETIGNCLYALFSSLSFEEAIRKVISYGGDSDTNACIVGAMAEALYGVDDSLINKAREFVPIEFSNKLDKAYSLIKKKNI